MHMVHGMYTDKTPPVHIKNCLKKSNHTELDFFRPLVTFSLAYNFFLWQCWSHWSAYNFFYVCYYSKSWYLIYTTAYILHIYTHIIYIIHMHIYIHTSYTLHIYTYTIYIIHMYIYMYIYIYIYTHTYTSHTLYSYTCTHIHIHIHHIFIHIHM